MRTVAILGYGTICFLRICGGESRGVRKREMAKFNFTSGLFIGRHFCAAIVNLRFSGENVIETAHGSGAALKNIGDPAESNHRTHENGKVPVKRDERPKGNLPAQKLMAALPEHDEKGRAD